MFVVVFLVVLERLVVVGFPVLVAILDLDYSVTNLATAQVAVHLIDSVSLFLVILIALFVLFTSLSSAGYA